MPFLLFYFFNVKVGMTMLWVAFYVSSFILSFLVRLILFNDGAKLEDLKIAKYDLIIPAVLILLMLFVFFKWHYVKSSSSAMYYVWLDVCRYWHDTGEVFPQLPAVNPVTSFLSPLIYSPALLSVLLLLTSHVQLEFYFNSFGLLVALCNAGVLLSMIVTSKMLFKNIWVGLFSFYLCISNDFWSTNGTALLIKVGSHNSILLYVAFLVILCSVLIYRRSYVLGLSFFTWMLFSGISMRPYLAPYVLAWMFGVIILIVLKNHYSNISNYLNMSFIRSFFAALILGLIVFSWQFYLLYRYGSLFVYNHDLVYFRLNDYHLVSDLFDRIKTFWTLVMNVYFGHIMNLFSLQSFSPSNSHLTVSGFVLLGILLCAILLKVFFSKFNILPITTFFLVSFLFVILCVVINVNHNMIVVSWLPFIYFIGASGLYLIAFGRRSIQNITFLATITFILFNLFFPLLGWSSSPITIKNGIRQLVDSQVKAGWNGWRYEDDELRNEISSYVRKYGGKIMLIRAEPGADAVFYVPNEYYWTQRYILNDCDKIMILNNWDPVKVAKEFRKEGIKWILQPSRWDVDNCAGMETLRHMKSMIDERPDIYIPVVMNKGSNHQGFFYEIRLPKGV